MLPGTSVKSSAPSVLPELWAFFLLGGDCKINMSRHNSKPPRSPQIHTLTMFIIAGTLWTVTPPTPGVATAVVTISAAVCARKARGIVAQIATITLPASMRTSAAEKNADHTKFTKVCNEHKAAMKSGGKAAMQASEFVSCKHLIIF